MADGNWDETFDLVIVGSGGGSMCAALVAKDHGKSVVILEKQDKVGGSTGFSGGVWWIPNNPLMAREGIADSYERARQYLDAVVPELSPATSPARREAFLKSGPEMVEYLERKGMKFKRVEGYADYHDDLPGGEPRSRSLIAELFDINELGPWKVKLSMYPGALAPFGNDEMPDLLLMKCTWKGKRMALKIGLRMLMMKLAGKEYRGTGAAIQGRMLQMVLRENIPIRTETPVQDFIVEDGQVVGVIAQHLGKTLRIRARTGVLINAGGFSRNADFRRQHARQPTGSDWTLANPGDTGEAMQAAMNLGAATDLLDAAVWGCTSICADGSLPQGAQGRDGRPLPFGHHFDISFPHVILVDQDGQRFADEAGSYVALGEAMYANQQRTGDRGGRSIPAWAIIESRHRKRYPWGPVLGKWPQAWFDSGYMIEAGSIEELARKCSIDPARLRASIERFNGFAKKGVDEDFNRGGRAFDRFHGDPSVTPNPNLGAIEQAPFYACRIVPGDVGTSGGLVTDEHGRVLRGDGTPIAGLYACGNSAATVCGRSYPGAGASIGHSFVFGYRAALHATAKR